MWCLLSRFIQFSIHHNFIDSSCKFFWIYIMVGIALKLLKPIFLLFSHIVSFHNFLELSCNLSWKYSFNSVNNRLIYCFHMQILLMIIVRLLFSFIYLIDQIFLIGDKIIWLVGLPWWKRWLKFFAWRFKEMLYKIELLAIDDCKFVHWNDWFIVANFIIVINTNFITNSIWSIKYYKDSC